MFGEKALEGIAEKITKIVAKEIVQPITKTIISTLGDNLNIESLVKELKETNKQLKQIAENLKDA